MPPATDRSLHAAVWQADGRWVGRLEGSTERFEDPSRESTVAALRRAAGPGVTLTIEVAPLLAGVTEAARIMGWDRRRVVTYLDRGSFPPPIASLASGRVWLRSDVERYAREWHERRRERELRAAGE